MKVRIAWLALIGLALTTVPAASQIYSNGPLNGKDYAWAISSGYSVSDTFYLNYGYAVTGFDFWTWVYPGDTLLTVDWVITGMENARPIPYGAGTASVTDRYLSSNPYGYSIHEDSVSGLWVQLQPGRYWLTLENATTSSGNPLYWDENSGIGCWGQYCPSFAMASSEGSVPSEAFAVHGCAGCACDVYDHSCGPLQPADTPEPSSLILFVSGIVGLAGVLRRRLF